MNHPSRTLMAALLFLVLANTWWAGPQRGSPQHWDSAVHFSESLSANRVLDREGGVPVKALLTVSWYYPPFVSYVAIPFYRMFGESEVSGVLVMTFFLVVLIFSVYAIGKRLFDAGTGLLAAILTSSFPIVIAYSRMFMLDLPLMAMAGLFIYLLLASDHFERIWISLAAGLIFGFGMLTKWTFVFFVIGPLAYSCWKGVRSARSRRGRVLTILASGVVAFAVFTPWYMLHIVQIMTSRSGELGRGDLTPLQSVFYYLTELPGETSWIGCAVLLIGCVIFFARGRKSGAFLGLWFLSAYIIVTIIHFKNPRFALPLLIPISLVAASGLTTLHTLLAGNGSRWRILSTGVSAVVLLQGILVSFVPPESAVGTALGTPCGGMPLMAVQGATGDSWDNTSILSSVSRDMEASGRTRAVVRVIPDYIFLNNSTVAFYAQLHRLPVRIAGTSGFPMFSDYVIVRSGAPALDSSDHREKLTREILEDASHDSSAYVLLDSHDLPDGTRAVVMKLLPPPAPTASPHLILVNVQTAARQWIGRYFRTSEEYKLEIAEYDSLNTLRGHLKSLGVRMPGAEFGDFEFKRPGMPVSDVDVEIRDVVFNPKSIVENQRLEVYSLRDLSIRGICLRASDVMEFLSRAPTKGFVLHGISMSDGMLTAKGSISQPGWGVEVQVKLRSEENRNIRFEFQGARLGVVPVPAGLLNVLTDSYNPIIRGLDVIENVTIGELTLKNDEMRVGGH